MDNQVNKKSLKIPQQKDVVDIFRKCLLLSRL